MILLVNIFGWKDARLLLYIRNKNKIGIIAASIQIMKLEKYMGRRTSHSGMFVCLFASNQSTGIGYMDRWMDRSENQTESNLPP